MGDEIDLKVWFKKLMPKNIMSEFNKQVKRPYKIHIKDDEFTLTITYVLPKKWYNQFITGVAKKLHKKLDMPDAWEIGKDDPLVRKYIMQRIAPLISKVQKQIHRNKSRKKKGRFIIVNSYIDTMYFIPDGEKMISTVIIKGVCHV